MTPPKKAAPAKKVAPARKAAPAKKVAAKKVAAKKVAAPPPLLPDAGEPAEPAGSAMPDDGWAWASWDDEPADDADTAGPYADPRVQQGVDSIQRAAREFIQASRALLDVAEELVDDPRAASGLTDLFGEVGAVASRLARDALRGAKTGGQRSNDTPDDPPPVQRIPVS